MEEEAASEEKPPEKKSSMVKPIVAVVILAILAGAGFGGWTWYEARTRVQEGKTASRAPAHIAKTNLPDFFFSLDPFVVNLADPGGRRYLRTQIDLEYSTKDLQKELAARRPQLRNLILMVLTSKTFKSIQGVAGKIALRNEIITRINQLLQSGRIRNLYFTEFVVQ